MNAPQRHVLRTYMASIVKLIFRYSVHTTENTKIPVKRPTDLFTVTNERRVEIQ